MGGDALAAGQAGHACHGKILATREENEGLKFSAAEPQPQRSATGPRSQRVGRQGCGVKLGRPPEWSCGARASALSLSALQLFRILARREDFTVARPASSARHHFVVSDSLAPNSPAQFRRTHEPLHPVRHAGRLPCDCGALPSAPSLSAFLPISAVFHAAPPRSERYLKTPQRSERTQRGKRAEAPAPRTHCGGRPSFTPHLCRPTRGDGDRSRSAWVAALPPCVLPISAVFCGSAQWVVA